ncbi:MAG: tRNA epoxyqueuosine(34) reductase QueG [Bacteroidales bacterium]|jgi:epoxyqueuosine reductase
MNTRKEIWSEKIKEKAKSIGFADCKIAPAGLLETDAAHLKNWLKDGMQAGMHYMENHFEKRTDPGKLVPGAKSVVLVLLNYYPEDLIEEKGNFVISKYAYGRDYHKVMKSMLRKLQKEINNEIVKHEGRIFADSAPVLERALAAKAGLGWVGKNANLISPEHGSFVFIGELILNVELAYDRPINDFCGSCTKCLQACPTKAIIQPKVIDSRRCISYWTIEHKGAIHQSLQDTFRDRIFGCDICQDVCPWNRKSESTNVAAFRPSPDLTGMAKNDWRNLPEEKYERLFRGSAVKRAKYSGLMRNIRFVDR